MRFKIYVAWEGFAKGVCQITREGIHLPKYYSISLCSFYKEIHVVSKHLKRMSHCTNIAEGEARDILADIPNATFPLDQIQRCYSASLDC
ncbi:MAG: hypothetical protein ACW967_04280 [Candidatus Hodarchaeales archaeon]|jgi:hypothetical protein